MQKSEHRSERKAKPSGQVVGRSLDPVVRSLRALLAEVEKLFGDTRRDCACCYDFTLGKFPNGWRFNVVNDWHKWMDAGREHEFGNYETPEAAVSAFLEYVKTERINPAGLTHP